MRLFGAFNVFCILVALVSSVPHSANAQPGQPAGTSAERPVEKGAQQSSDLVNQAPKASRSLESIVTTLRDFVADHPIWAASLGIPALLVLIGVGVLLYRAGRSDVDPHIPKLKPSFFFWLGMIYTGVLLFIAVIYSHLFNTTQLLGDILPVAVPWFGALGAVTISLEGVFMWNKQWDDKYNYWHIGRPLFGAVLGIMAFFLYVLIITASGSEIAFLKAGSVPAGKDLIIFYMVAFLVGYREETFRELIKRVSDLILKPSTQSAPSPAVSFKRAGVTLFELAMPATVAAASSTLTVEVHNTGDAPLKAPVVSVSVTSPTPAGTFVMANDQVSGAVELAPGQSRTVDLTFAPNAAGDFSGSLTVSGENLATSKSIRIAGTGT